MKKTIAILLACVMLLSMIPMTGAAKFTDVRTADWFYPYVRDLTADGTIAGQTATTFNPNGSLTYGAALKLLNVSVLGKDAGNAVSGHWAMNYLNEAVAAGWTDADAAKLDAPITREVFCQIAAKAKNYTEQPASNPFKDTSDPGVLAMVQAGVISGMSADTFAPNGVLTRAQIAKIIWCMKNPGKTPTAPTKEEIAADVVEVTAVKILQTLSMNVGTSQKFTVSIEPSNATNKEVSWTAGNPGVATIDSKGVITAHKAGQCHITAMANNGVKATCLVTVKEVPVTSIEILETLTMNVGTSQKFTVNIKPSSATAMSITWKAGNPGVATVDANGIITAHKAGQCHITATASNGVKATCLVTVKDVEVTHVSINGYGRLDPGPWTLIVGESRTLKAEVEPSNAGNKTIVWSSNNEKVASVNQNGTVTAIKAGKATITAKANNGKYFATTVYVSNSITADDLWGKVNATLLAPVDTFGAQKVQIRIKNNSGIAFEVVEETFQAFGYSFSGTNTPDSLILIEPGATGMLSAIFFNFDPNPFDNERPEGLDLTQNRATFKIKVGSKKFSVQCDMYGNAFVF